MVLVRWPKRFGGLRPLGFSRGGCQIPLYVQSHLINMHPHWQPGRQRNSTPLTALHLPEVQPPDLHRQVAAAERREQVCAQQDGGMRASSDRWDGGHYEGK